MAKRIKKLFNMTTPELIAWVKLIYIYYSQDKADFEEYSSKYNDEFASGWNAKIIEAEGLSSDDDETSVLTGKTVIVEDEMENGRRHYMKLKGFVVEIYRNKPAILNEFGISRYAKVRKSQEKFPLFLKDVKKAADRHKADIIKDGFSQEMIDLIETIADIIISANSEQDSFKGTKPVVTEDRTTKLNNLYLFTRDLCEAGKQIFYKSAAKQSRYLLPSTEGGQTPPPPPPPEQ